MKQKSTLFLTEHSRCINFKLKKTTNDTGFALLNMYHICKKDKFYFNIKSLHDLILAFYVLPPGSEQQRARGPRGLGAMAFPLLQ